MRYGRLPLPPKADFFPENRQGIRATAAIGRQAEREAQQRAQRRREKAARGPRHATPQDSPAPPSRFGNMQVSVLSAEDVPHLGG